MISGAVTVIKRLMPSEAANRQFLRKSVVVTRDIRAGQSIESGDLTSKRPGTGLEPSWIDKLIGRRARRDIPCDSHIALGDVDWNE